MSDCYFLLVIGGVKEKFLLSSRHKSFDIIIQSTRNRKWKNKWPIRAVFQGYQGMSECPFPHFMLNPPHLTWFVTNSFKMNGPQWTAVSCKELWQKWIQKRGVGKIMARQCPMFGHCSMQCMVTPQPFHTDSTVAGTLLGSSGDNVAKLGTILPLGYQSLS